MHFGGEIASLYYRSVVTSFTGLRRFTILWFGHLTSVIGTSMADFAITLWVWDQTESATALTLWGFFYQFPRLFTSLFAGILVDRFSRKKLMILSESVAATTTIALLGLLLTNQLVIWHLYVAFCINGGFQKFWQLAYRASLTLLVNPENYTRANSMNTAIGYTSAITAPALAGMFYPRIGLEGIWSINLATFVFAIVIIALLKIPQPLPGPVEKTASRIATAWKEAIFGFRYLLTSPSLRSLLLVTTLFWATLHLTEMIYDPMILARTDGSSEALAAVWSIAGIGGVTSAVLVSLWGGPRRRVNGMLTGFMGAGLAKTVFGIGQSLSVWMPAQFFSSMSFPLIESSEMALWTLATPAAVQGRVFAAHFLTYELVTAPIALIAGPLSDRIFEPAMQSSRFMQAVFGPIVGTGSGSGMGLLFTLSAIIMLLVGLSSYRWSQLLSVERANKDAETL
ncbi:MAG: MFS transporter [Cyanobacteria bacterium P01_B01_bin.77]